MHKCKYCGAQLSKLDKDICPFCGGRKPLEGVEDVTEDITKSLDSLTEDERKSIEPKSKVIAFVLAVLCGVFGGHSFYLGFKKTGFITIGITLLFVGGLGSVLFFSHAVYNALAFLIPYFIMEAFMIAVGIIYLVRSDIKDSRGEFLR